MNGLLQRPSRSVLRRRAGVRRVVAAVFLAVSGIGVPGFAQRSLDDRLDHETFLDGLGRQGISDVLDTLEDDPAVIGADTDPAWQDLIAVARARVLLAKSTNAAISGGTRSDRDGAIQALLSARRTLIRNHQDDLRVARWQGDLARDLLFLSGTDAGLDLTVEFGLSSLEQAQHLRDLAAEAVAQTDEALYAVDDWILAIEDDPAYDTDIDLQALRRQLITTEKSQRLPFLLGQARYVWAVAAYRCSATAPATDPGWTVTDLAGDMQREVTDALTEARDLLRPLAAALPDPWQQQAVVTAALADIRLGGGPGPSAETLEAIANDALSASAANQSNTARLRAALGLAAVRGIHESALSAMTSLNRLAAQGWVRANPLLLLLVADSHVLWQFQSAETPDWAEGIENQAVVAPLMALDIYQTEFLGRAGLELPRDAQDSLIDRRLSLLMPATIGRPSDWPSPLLLARAQALASAPESNSEALALLDLILERGSEDSVSTRLRPRALYLAAAINLAAGETNRAVNLLLEVAQSHSMYERAPDAAYRAATLALMAYRSAGRSASGTDDVTELLQRTLSLCLAKYPAHAEHDRAALQLASLALDRHAYDDCDAALATVPRYGSPESADAAWLRIRAVLQQLREEADSGRSTDVTATKGLEVIAAAQQSLAASAVGSTSDVLSVAATLALAECHLALSQADQALSLLESVSIDISASEADAQRSDAGRMPRTRRPVPSELLAEQVYLTIRSLEQLGRDAEIDGWLRRLLSEIPAAQAGTVVDDLMVRTHERLLAQSLEQPLNEPIVVEADRRLVPLCEWLWRIRQADTGSQSTAATRFYLAEGYRFAGRYADALPHYEQLYTDDPQAMLPLFGLAECRFQANPADPESFRAFSRLSARLTQEDRLQYPGVYWLTELRLLQILDSAQRNTDRVSPRIRRLRLTDPTLGGDRYAESFESLERKYR